jgi:hypothetical protein
VKWEAPADPPATIGWTNRRVSGTGIIPGEPPGGADRAKRDILSNARQSAFDWSEAELFCPRGCRNNPATEVPVDIVIPGYSDEYLFGGTDAAGNAWEAKYQATAQLTFKKHKWTRECSPAQSGTPMAMALPDQGQDILVAVLASLDPEAKIRIAKALMARG